MTSGYKVAIIKVRGRHHSTSYDLFVADEFIGNYRLRTEALAASKARIAQLIEEELQLREFFNDLESEL